MNHTITNTIRWTSLFVLTALSLASTSCAAESGLEPIPSGMERGCLSLRVLIRQAARAIAEGAPFGEEALSLGGLSYIEGYILDETGEKDLILVGLRGGKRPALRLDDLVVAVRSIWAAEDGAFPYCSLDPTPESVKALEKLFASEDMGANGFPAFFEKLKKTVGPQQVVVGGIPRDSRTAHIFIEADYRMKEGSQGRIEEEGVKSVLERICDEARTSLAKTNKPPALSLGMSRFWFHIQDGTPAFQTHDGIVWIDRCPVVLLTERQNATADGRLYDVKADDPLSVAFARDMSAQLPALARKVPIYAELENIFRLRALLLALRHRKVPEQAGLDFADLLPGYRPSYEKPIGASRPGLANHKELKHETRSGNVIRELRLYPMVCGGVAMDMSVAPKSFKPASTPHLQGLRKLALRLRPALDALAWLLPANA